MSLAERFRRKGVQNQGTNPVFFRGSLERGPELARVFLDPVVPESQIDAIVAARERTELLNGAIALITEPLELGMFVAASQGLPAAIEARHRPLKKGKRDEWVKSWKVSSTYPVPQERTQNDWVCRGDLVVGTAFDLGFQTKNPGTGEELDRVETLVADNQVLTEGGDPPEGMDGLFQTKLIVRDRKIEAVGFRFGYDGRLSRILSEVSPAYKKLFDLGQENEYGDRPQLEMGADLRFAFGGDSPSLEVGNNITVLWYLVDNRPHPDQFVFDPDTNQFVFQPKQILRRIDPHPDFLKLRKIPAELYMELLTAVTDLIPKQA